MSVLMPPSDKGPLFAHPYSQLPEPVLAPARPQPPAPDEACCTALWEKYAMPPHIRRHCKVVAHIACTLAGRALARGFEVDVAQVKAAGLLHDLGKAYSIQYGAGHAHLGASWVVAWQEEGVPVRESYVNLIPTPAGGTHESGLREGLYLAMKAFIEAHGLMQKNVKLLTEDVFARASAILSAKVLDPQFQGQTKERLNNRDALRLVSNFVRAQFEFWLNGHVEEGKKLAELVIKQAQARQNSAKKVTKRKGSSVAVLPGKLTDCESEDISKNELFLVEGDSAGGSAKKGRNKDFQAILPLRGKVLNTWEVDRDRIFANNEIHDISVAIGVDPHGPDEEPDLSELRYGKICIMADADVDGSHIQVLLLTLFFRHFPALIKKGHIFVARPPLFRMDVPKTGRKPARTIYCLDERELAVERKKLEKEKVNMEKVSVSRFKGLGEMSDKQLWETTLNPETRRLMPVTFGDMTLSESREMFDMLMGRSEAAMRRAWMENNGDQVEVDI